MDIQPGLGSPQVPGPPQPTPPPAPPRPAAPPQPAPQPPQPAFQAPRQPGPGDLIVFHYRNWKNDPTPMVIVSRIIPGYQIKGVNLHYLAFRQVGQVLRTAGGNPAFTYYNIKADRYISSAFRSYSWGGVDFGSMRVLDVGFLLQSMRLVTSFDPLKIRAIRAEIERQLSQQINQPVAQPGPVQPAPEPPQQPEPTPEF